MGYVATRWMDSRNRTGWGRLSGWAGSVLLSLSLAGTPAAALTTMTMDDLPTQAINGLSHLGVNFGFTIGGLPSGDSRYNNPTGPGLTTYTTDPSIEGNTDGVITLDFDNPTDILEIGFALAVTTPETAAVTVDLYDGALAFLGSFDVDIDPGAFAFSSGQFQSLQGLCIGRAVISFDSFGDRFVMDDLTYEETDQCGCPSAPEICVGGFGKAQLVVNEKNAGKEKLTAKLLKGPMLTQPDFGDPVTGTSAYSLCIYDDIGTLAGVMEVDRAGDTCTGNACWKSLGGPPLLGKGYKYKDKASTSDGVLLINAKAGNPGRSKVLVKAKNSTGNMPTGIAANLNGTTAVIMQVHVDDGLCFEATAFNIVKDDGSFFKAK